MYIVTELPIIALWLGSHLLRRCLRQRSCYFLMLKRWQRCPSAICAWSQGPSDCLLIFQLKKPDRGSFKLSVHVLHVDALTCHCWTIRLSLTVSTSFQVLESEGSDWLVAIND